MPDRRPRAADLPELLLQLGDRLRRVESRYRHVVGTGTNAYVLEVNPAGQLTARHATTGTVTVIANP